MMNKKKSSYPLWVLLLLVCLMVQKVPRGSWDQFVTRVVILALIVITINVVNRK